MNIEQGTPKFTRHPNFDIRYSLFCGSAVQNPNIQNSINSVSEPGSELLNEKREMFCDISLFFRLRRRLSEVEAPLNEQRCVCYFQLTSVVPPKL